MSLASKILIVDDEPAIRRLLARTLERSDYRVVEAADARAALNALAIDKPDLVLLDLGLPDRDGLELLPLMVKAGGPAVLVVSARDATTEKVTSLDLGADDFVTKPFDSEELLARIRASLRRRTAAASEMCVVDCGDISIDLVARQVTRDGAIVHLTPKEWGVLAALAAHPGRIITHIQLLRTVWGPAHEADIEYLRVVMRALRQKLEASATPDLLRNEPGVGYRLCQPTLPAVIAGQTLR